MDGVSTAIGLLSASYTACKKIREVRRAIKGAPDQLESLEHSCAFTEQLLDVLKTACSRLPSDIDFRYPEYLSDQARGHLVEVERIADKVTRGHSTRDGKTRERTIHQVKWMLQKENIQRIEAEMKELQGTLGVMLSALQSHYSATMLTRIDNVETTLASMSQPDLRQEAIGTRNSAFAFTGCDKKSEITVMASYNADIQRPRLDGPLLCPPKCECRCHYPSVAPLFPACFASLIGQLSISKRLLHPAFSQWSLCNVQSCRGDFQSAMTIRWILPSGLLHGFLQSRRDRRIHFCISSPRIVLWDSPIIKAVWYGNLQGVRNLFATGQASIWDYTVNHVPIIQYACQCWQNTSSEEHLGIICFLVEAGAEALIFEQTQTIHSAHDVLAIGLFKYILDKASDESKSTATILRTNTTAITIFRSSFNIDPMDALEDCLARKRPHCGDISGLVASLENPRCYSTNRSSFFEMLGYSVLEYAVEYSHNNVENLLADGENAAVGPILALSVANRRSFLIKALLDAGADVNMKDAKGYAAILLACSQFRYYEFFDLLRWAGDDIDWDVCSPDGRNALDLFDECVSKGAASLWPRPCIDEFRRALVVRMRIRKYDFERLDMPGSFPRMQ